MLFKSKSTKYLFDNVKNGDFLGFYKKPWYYIFAKLISVVTGNKLSHIAAIFDVKRSANIVTFKLGEQLVSEGKVIKKYSIVKITDEGYTIDSRFRQKNTDLYLLSNRFIINDKENSELATYWKEQEDYSIEELPFTINWFHKLFGKKDKIYDNNCSTAARMSMLRIGMRDAKFDDVAPNPTEFAKFSYIHSITKIDCSK